MKAGTARFQIAVTSGKFNDAAEISLPVWTPATTEAFATYGTTDQNGAIIQPVQTPGDVFPQFGGLEVTTSSTQLQELTDAFLYLTNYPYACSEQISSRMISIAAMRDVLNAFKAKDMPTAKELDKYFARDIEILQSRQRDDGSFGLWKRDKERYEYPFLTIHVAHALALAKAKGYKVPDEMLNKTKPYLKNVEKHFDEWYKNSPEVRWTISAYASVHPRHDGRQGHGKGQETACRGDDREDAVRGSWLDIVGARERPELDGRGSGDHSSPDEPHDRRRRRRQISSPITATVPG